MAILKNGHFEKSAILISSKKKNFFCFIFMKISPNLYGRMDGSKFWHFPWFPGNFLLCVIYRYTVYFTNYSQNFQVELFFKFLFCIAIRLGFKNWLQNQDYSLTHLEGGETYRCARMSQNLVGKKNSHISMVAYYLSHIKDYSPAIYSVEFRIEFDSF